MQQTSTAQVSGGLASEQPRRSLTFVVHGVGEQPKSSELQIATEGFLSLVRRKLDPRAVISAKPADDEGPAEVTLAFSDRLLVAGPPRITESPDAGPPAGSVKYEARFVEIWWQAAFSAPGLGEMAMGMVSIMSRWGRTQAWGAEDDKDRNALVGFAFALGFLLARLLLNIVVFLPLMAFVVVAGPVLLFVAFVSSYRTYPGGPFTIPRPVKALLLRTSDVATKAQPLIVEIGLVILSPLIVLLLLVLWIFEAILPAESLGKLQSLHIWLVKLITRSWGDLWLYVERPWQASRIRVRFEQQFSDVIERMDPAVETVVILAHSMGSAIVYEALTGPRLRPLLESKFGPGVAAGHIHPRLHLVTLGSALNIVWTVMDEEERHRFVAPLPAYIGWLNLWTYLDPYARQALRIPDESYQVRPSLRHKGVLQPVREIEVINQQDMFSDHSAYWNNASQVIAPVLDILTMASVTPALKLDVSGRMLRVSVLSFFKALAWSLPVFVFIGLFAYVQLFNHDENWPSVEVADFLRDAAISFAASFPEDFRSMVNSIVGAIPEPLLELAPHWMRDGDVSKEDIQQNLFAPWAVAGVAAILATLVYSTVVKWLWDLWDQGHKYD